MLGQYSRAKFVFEDSVATRIDWVFDTTNTPPIEPDAGTQS
jgi:hypothetical protein